jgi:hypothetical protein
MTPVPRKMGGAGMTPVPRFGYDAGTTENIFFLGATFMLWLPRVRKPSAALKGMRPFLVS